MYECEDERDAKRLRKRSAAAAKGGALIKSGLMKSLTDGADDDGDDHDVPGLPLKGCARDLQVL